MNTQPKPQTPEKGENSGRVIQKIIDEFDKCAYECVGHIRESELDYEICVKSCMWSLIQELSKKYNVPKATVRKILKQQLTEWW